MQREAQGVLASELRRRLGVAPLQRLDDRHVIDDRARRAVVLWIVTLRIARMWMNKFSVSSAKSAQPLMRMIAW